MVRAPGGAQGWEPPTFVGGEAFKPRKRPRAGVIPALAAALKASAKAHVVIDEARIARLEEPRSTD